MKGSAREKRTFRDLRPAENPGDWRGAESGDLARDAYRRALSASVVVRASRAETNASADALGVHMNLDTMLLLWSFHESWRRDDDTPCRLR
jgi:hypothetical protein